MKITHPPDGHGFALEFSRWQVGAWLIAGALGVMIKLDTRDGLAYQVMIWPFFSIRRFRCFRGPNRPVGAKGYRKKIV